MWKVFWNITPTKSYENYTSGGVQILRKFYFLVRDSLLEMSASSLAMNLKFKRNKFGKRTVCNWQTKIRF